MDNVLKFTPDGGAAHVVVDGGETDVRLTIADTGIGIPENGLGLAITKSIVERHGGRITVHRRDPAGTVVTCHLPRA